MKSTTNKAFLNYKMLLPLLCAVPAVLFFRYHFHQTINVETQVVNNGDTGYKAKTDMTKNGNHASTSSQKPEDVNYQSECSIIDFMTRKVNVTSRPRGKNQLATYSDLYITVYQKLNYSLRAPSTIECRNLKKFKLALLPMIARHPKSCERVFGDWLSAAKNHITPKVAVKEINETLQSQYTLLNTVAFGINYANDVVMDASLRLVYNQSYFNEMWAWLPKNFVHGSYYSDTVAVNLLYAMRRVGVRGARVAVLGTEKPWAEAIALYLGAKEVVTFEYRELKIEHPAVRVIHPIQAAENWTSLPLFDHMISFSSIEHSGFGRYGDFLTPDGDLNELRKIHCFLKPGGTLLLGIPINTDVVHFNGGRQTGALRLPLMFAVGFELVHFYANKRDRDDIAELGVAVNEQYGKQPVMVMRKINWSTSW